MSKYSVDLTIQGIDGEMYDEIIGTIVSIIEGIGLKVEVGIGAEEEYETPSSFDNLSDTQKLSDMKHGTSCGMK